MKTIELKDIKISGISACIPKNIKDIQDVRDLSEKDKNLFIKTTDIRYRRIIDSKETASDLCCYAAEKLLAGLGWEPHQVDVLIFISQTPDYITPFTASTLQDRLGISHNCICFDINLGCSAYPLGFTTIGSILNNIPGGKGLLLIGDKMSHIVQESDKGTGLIFSDAGSATALEVIPGQASSWHHIYTDGSRYDNIIVKTGGTRNPSRQPYSSEITYDDFLYLNGINIFQFALKDVAPSILNLLASRNQSVDDIDYFIFHQANKIINETMRKNLKIPAEKFPSTLPIYGNTSSASIPITIVSQLGKKLNQGSYSMLLSGFGVGLSWANSIIQFDHTFCLPIIEV